MSNLYNFESLKKATILLGKTKRKLTEKIENIELKKYGPKLTLSVHTISGEAYKDDDREGTIVILPGLDDSVFHYETAFNYFRTYNPEWGILGIDLRGQGKTRDDEGNIYSSKITLEEQTEILDQILEKNKIDSAFIVGLSYGGGVALQYAKDYPARVLGLGLIAPYVTNFKAYKAGLTGIYYGLSFYNPFYKMLSKYSLPPYFMSAKIKGRLNPQTNWTSQRMKALSKLTMGILDLNTDKVLDEMTYLPIGIHLLTACQDTVVPIAAHRHFYNRIPKNILKSFSLEDGIGHRVLQQHPKQASMWIHRLLLEYSELEKKA